MPAENYLEKELEYYEKHKSDWLPDRESQFVVIAGSKIAGFYPDYETAWDAGARQFGAENSFLIKQICSHEPVYLVY